VSFISLLSWLEGSCSKQLTAFSTGVLDADDWRQNKRSIEYLVAKPLSDYGFKSIPGESGPA